MTLTPKQYVGLRCRWRVHPSSVASHARSPVPSSRSQAPQAASAIQFASLDGALTATCVALAIAYHYVEPWLVDRAAAEAIAEAGGSAESIPVGPDFLREWFGSDFLQRITAVNLSQPEATAACLAHLPKLTWLRKAELAGAKFTDEHLTVVAGLDLLRELTLRGTTVTPERLTQLAAERPDLHVTAEPLEISFADLRFEVPKGQPFSRDHLPERILRSRRQPRADSRPYAAELPANRHPPVRVSIAVSGDVKLPQSASVRGNRRGDGDRQVVGLPGRADHP